MSEELLQNESHSQSSRFHIFLKMFSFLIPLLDVIKLVIASVTSVVFLAFASLTLAGSAVALVVSTPIFIIFSPILVPATIATTLLATGLAAGATLGVTAIGLIMGLIKTAEGTPLKMLKFSGGYGGSWGGKTFSGTFGDKSAGGAAPAGGGKPAGGSGWSWDGKSFSGKIPEWLKNQPWFKNIPIGSGGIPASGGAPAGGGAPASGGAPTGGSAPASEAEPAGGSAPAPP